MASTIQQGLSDETKIGDSTRKFDNKYLNINLNSNVGQNSPG